MEEPVAEDDWVLQYYIPTLGCDECGAYFPNNEDSSSSEETLIKLKEHLSGHNMKYDSVQNIYVKEKIPASRYVRKHYSKLKEKVAVKCNYCSEEFNYRGREMIGGLHDHLIFKHKEKLTNEEMDNTRIHWSWDHFKSMGERHVSCYSCGQILEAKTGNLITHLRKHNEIGRSSESDTDDTSNDRDMNRSSRKEKRQEDSEALSKNIRETTGGTSALSDKTIITPKQEAEDKNVLQHYISTLKCQECQECFFNIKDGSSYKINRSKELKDHLFREHGKKRDSVYNEVEVEFPERRYLRKHYSKLKGRSIKCNHCFAIYPLYTHMDYIFRKKHEDKITQRPKKLDDKEFQWYWNNLKRDYHINAKCKYCKKTYKAFFFRGPYFGFRATSPDIDVETSSDSDIDTPTKKAKRQEDTETLSKHFDEAGPSKGT